MKLNFKGRRGSGRLKKECFNAIEYDMRTSDVWVNGSSGD